MKKSIQTTSIFEDPLNILDKLFDKEMKIDRKQKNSLY